MELRLDPEIPVTRVVNGHNVFNKGYHHGLRGKTYEEYYGKERAVEIRKRHSEALKGHRYWSNGNAIAGHRAFFMADANQYIADEVQPDLLKMEYSIKLEFDKCRIENSALLAKVELTRCMAELACLSLDKRIEEVRPYNKEVTGITYLRLTDTLKVLDELSDILYKGGYCDLNQSDNCKRGMAIIQRKLTDCDIISRAINESDKLNPAGDDE